MTTTSSRRRNPGMADTEDGGQPRSAMRPSMVHAMGRVAGCGGRAVTTRDVLCVVDPVLTGR
ncbi:hypothetical protein [Kocuria sp. KH4]